MILFSPTKNKNNNICHVNINDNIPVQQYYTFNGNLQNEPTQQVRLLKLNIFKV